MAPRWTDETNVRFVELYKEQRCLWDQRHELYKDRNARETALAAIAENMAIHGFGIAEVKAKIKSFRGTFNIELAKQQRSAKSGCGPADVYVPTLKWFNLMKEVMAKGTLSRDWDTISTSTETVAVFPESSIDVVLPTESSSGADSPEPTPSPRYFLPLSTRPNSRKRKAAKVEQAAALVGGETEPVRPEEPLDVFGKHVANKLRTVRPDQIKFAQKLISDVLFEADMESLNRHCKVDVVASEAPSK